MTTIEARIREALTLHQLATTSRERYCLCGFFLGAWANAATTAAHQAAVLAGIVQEAMAGAAAQALRDAADALDSTASVSSFRDREAVTDTWLKAADVLRARADLIHRTN